MHHAGIIRWPEVIPKLTTTPFSIAVVDEAISKHIVERDSKMIAGSAGKTAMGAVGKICTMYGNFVRIENVKAEQRVKG
jgi:hypothetical protein